MTAKRSDAFPVTTPLPTSAAAHQAGHLAQQIMVLRKRDPHGVDAAIAPLLALCGGAVPPTRAHAVHMPAAAGEAEDANGRLASVPPIAFPTFMQALTTAPRDLLLVRLSLNLPPDRHADYATAVRMFGESVEASGERHSAWIVRDLRPKDLAPHAYAIVLCDAATKAKLLGWWCEFSGASLSALAKGGPAVLKVVDGWKIYAEDGDATKLRAGLLGRQTHGALTYGVKPLPASAPRPRDLDADVFVFGPLAAAWRASRAAGEGLPAGTSRARLPAMALGVPRTCALDTCGKSLDGKRADAKFCSTEHRMAARERGTARRDDDAKRSTFARRGTDTSDASGIRSVDVEAFRRDARVAFLRELRQAFPGRTFTAEEAHEQSGQWFGISRDEVADLLDDFISRKGNGYAFRSRAEDRAREGARATPEPNASPSVPDEHAHAHENVESGS